MVESHLTDNPQPDGTPTDKLKPTDTPRVEAWKEFCHLWTQDTARTQYAHKVLGMPLLQAYSFAQDTLDSKTDMKVKSWHTDLRRLAFHLPNPEVLRHLDNITVTESYNELEAAVQKAAQVVNSCPDFNEVRYAAWTLTTGGRPQAGIIIGLAMLLPNGPYPPHSRPLHPRDGKSLVDQSLRIMEESPALTEKFGEWISDMRKQFPKSE